MKHAILILILSIGLYLSWYYAPTSAKRSIKKVARQHAAFLIFMAVLVAAGISAAFCINSSSIL